MLRKYTYVYLGGCLGKFSRRHYSAQMVQFKPSAISDDYVIGQLALSLSSFFCLFFFSKGTQKEYCRLLFGKGQRRRKIRPDLQLPRRMSANQKFGATGCTWAPRRFLLGFQTQCLVMWNGNYLWGGGGGVPFLSALRRNHG